MELVIFDLGYFCVKTFKQIADKGAFFISRIKTNTVFYIQSLEKEGKFTKLEKKEFVSLLKKAGNVIDQWIYIGGRKDTRMKVRIVGVRLPEDVVSERRRKANKKAKASGKTLSNYELELLAWNLLITDVTENMLSAETICELYRIRWQVELIFKSWKSCFEIDEVGEAGKDYVECLIYGKLIIITLMTTLYSHALFNVYQNQRKGISMQRFFLYLREKIDVLIEPFVSMIKIVQEFLKQLENVVKRSMEESRKRKTTEQVLMDHALPPAMHQNGIKAA